MGAASLRGLRGALLRPSATLLGWWPKALCPWPSLIFTHPHFSNHRAGDTPNHTQLYHGFRGGSSTNWCFRCSHTWQVKTRCLHKSMSGWKKTQGTNGLPMVRRWSASSLESTLFFRWWISEHLLGAHGWSIEHMGSEWINSPKGGLPEINCRG